MSEMRMDRKTNIYGACYKTLSCVQKHKPEESEKEIVYENNKDQSSLVSFASGYIYCEFVYWFRFVFFTFGENSEANRMEFFRF